MAAKKIVLIVEGDGEVTAAPVLLTYALQHVGCFDVFPRQPAMNAHGGGNLTCSGGLERFLELAYRSPECEAVLLLIDSEGQCPKEMAAGFAARIRAKGVRKPTAVVVAHRMYEVWFVASASSLGGAVSGSRQLNDSLEIPRDPENIKDPKRWIESKMTPPQYKETEDQVALTRKIDFDLAQANSRSFRRFLHAVAELVDAIGSNTALVTP
jgi:hypothetical protein